MEPENRHLEDFFRKKLNEPSQEGDGWDRPDPAVWAAAQSQLAPTPTAATVFTLWHAVAAVGLVLVLANLILGDIFQQRQVANLQNTLTTKEQRIGQLEEQLQAQANSLSVAPTITPTPAEKAETQHQVAYLQSELQQMRQEIAALQALASSQTSREAVQPQPEPRTASPQPALASLSTRSFHLQINPLSAKTSTFLENSQAFDDDSPQSKSKLKPSFELGIAGGVSQIRTPGEFAFKNLRTVRQNAEKNRNSLGMWGLRGGLRLNKRWSIQTGFRMGDGAFSRSSEFQIAYQTENEYERPDGSRANDLTLRTANSHRQAESKVTVDIPADRRPGNNALLDVVVEEEQEISLVQIPLGIQYEHPFGRWQIVWQAGMQANRYAFGNLDRQMSITFRDRELPTERDQVPGERFEPKTFVSAYAGAGLNYHIHGNWVLSGLAQVSPQLPLGGPPELRRLNSSDNHLSMSLLYRF